VLEFGTDGIRGDAETELTAPLVETLARAVARVTGARRFLVARDTRVSGPRIEGDLARGLAREGVVTESAGVLPTPGLALLARARDEWAAMISASHNPWNDNGVKFFEPGGAKLSDEHQHAIESELQTLLAGSPASEIPAAATEAIDGAGPYSEHLRRQVPPGALRGLSVVLDCAHGAAYRAAPAAFRAAGAVVHSLHVEPDGHNINCGCGSTAPQRLQDAVVERGADIGCAFDGDADRVIAVDERGAIVDGDQIIAIMAIAMRDRDELTNGAVAVTVMSNLGLRRALRREGVDVVEVPVGDRQVIAAMRERDLAIGGEQSGHIIFGARSTTGDGTLTALLLAEHVVRSGRRLSDLASVMERLPQVLVNVPLGRRLDIDAAPAVTRAVRDAEQALGADGRVLVRASGTEPIVRVMVEAPTEQLAVDHANAIAAAIAAADE
jgi:phosphoglucosamine mutase